MMTKVRTRRCKVCKEPFTPFRSTLQRDCGKFECQHALALKHAEKERRNRDKAERLAKTRERKSDREKREAMKPIKRLKAEAQAAFNEYIRERDADLPCVSCGITNPPMTPGGQWDAGHFKSRGAFPELAFDEDNCHKQCKSCNAGGGRFSAKARTVNAAYEVELLRRIGFDRLSRLSELHEVKPLEREELKFIRDKYRRLTKELRAAREAMEVE
jgi:hypothetical protein